jgi:hypothetical protein
MSEELKKFKHEFADETYTFWCMCGGGFDSMDELDEHIKKCEEEAG